MSRYELNCRIGSGGMGEVFEAMRILSNGVRQPVACKSMRPEILRDVRSKELFHNEVAVSLSICHDHPNLVTVFDCIEDVNGRVHSIMELVEGCSLFELLQLHREIEPDILRVVAHDVLVALDHIHGHGLVHRDVSPCNVLISRKGTAKLSDLGLIMLANERTRSNRFRGKLAYASPEAIKIKPVDHRSDLFSFAAMMYEQITKQSPYGDVDDVWSVLHRLKRWRAPRLPDKVPEDLDTLIMGLLHRDRDKRRPQSAREALTILDMSNAQRAREQLAEMASAMYTRTVMRREEQTIIQGAIVSVEAIHSLKDQDAHADTTPMGKSKSSADCELDDESIENARTRADTRALAVSARRRRIALALASVGLFGVLAVGRDTLEPNGRSPARVSQIVMESPTSTEPRVEPVTEPRAEPRVEPATIGPPIGPGRLETEHARAIEHRQIAPTTRETSPERAGRIASVIIAPSPHHESRPTADTSPPEPLQVRSNDAADQPPIAAMSGAALTTYDMSKPEQSPNWHQLTRTYEFTRTD